MDAGARSPTSSRSSSCSPATPSAMTQDDIETVMDVFTPDGTYSAFGATYTLG